MSITASVPETAEPSESVAPGKALPSHPMVLSRRPTELVVGNRRIVINDERALELVKSILVKPKSAGPRRIVKPKIVERHWAAAALSPR